MLVPKHENSKKEWKICNEIDETILTQYNMFHTQDTQVNKFPRIGQDDIRYAIS